MEIIYRDGLNSKEIKYSKSVKFLYNTKVGRCILKLIANRTIAKLVGAFLNTRFSILIKNYVIKKNNINMNNYINMEYDNYNKFFTRKYKDAYLNVDQNKNVLISPCDSKLMIFKISDHNTFKIKNSHYKLEEIINDDFVNEYKNGYLLIFRLDVDDYHRYCFIDSGTRTDYQYIDGILHTVQPIVHDTIKVFHQNAREWCILNTDNFGDIIQVEVGALLVGKIVNHKNTNTFNKGEEKGYFEFNGSTILLFIKDGIVDFDKDIVKNSYNGNETFVKYGEQIGIKR